MYVCVCACVWNLRAAALVLLVLPAAAHRCSAHLATEPDVIGNFGHKGAADVPLWFLQQHKVLKHGEA